MQIDDKTCESIARDVIPIALTAGAAIERYSPRAVAVDTKADASPVTAADREAEQLILDGLGRCFPQIAVIAEEQVSAGDAPHPGQRFFLVDPLDGTKEFLRGSGEYTVNIGLVNNGIPVFGLIYAPARSELYVTFGARRAGFARVEPNALAPRLEAFEPIRSRCPEAGGLVALSSRSHQTQATRDFLVRHRIEKTLLSGSAIKFCMVARGEADVYPRFGPTWQWDTAAGHAILAAAGGCVLTADGSPLRYGPGENGFLNPGFIAWGREPVPA